MWRERSGFLAKAMAWLGISLGLASAALAAWFLCNPPAPIPVHALFSRPEPPKTGAPLTLDVLPEPVKISVPPGLDLVPVVRSNGVVVPFASTPVSTSDRIPPGRVTGADTNLASRTAPELASRTVPPLPVVTEPVRPSPTGARDRQEVLEAQLALDGRGFSPGSLDGVLGPQTRAALRAFQEYAGLPPSGGLDAATVSRLCGGAPVLTSYVVTSNDLARLLPVGETWLAKSQQDRLDYETLLELVAERSHSSPNLIRRLNPAIDWSRVVPGTPVTVPNAKLAAVTEKAAFVRIFLEQRVLQAYDANSNLLAHFPCSIAQRLEKRPVGELLRVEVAVPDPNYTFNPEIFPESAEGRELGRKLVVPPGPNNPVGVAWIGLDKPGYGIHGTPRPEQVGRTESHGCFRLANWNAGHLLQRVWVGMPVYVEP